MRPISLLVLVVALASGCAGTPPSGTPADLLIRDVTLIDVATGERIPARTVVVNDGRIAAILPSAVGAPATARVVDGHGRYLIPGLWDMHVHWYEEASLPVFLAHGVTGIRQMRGFTSMSATRAKGIEGSIASPRVYLASPLVEGSRTATPPALHAVDAGSARDIVQLVAGSSADFLKLYDQVPREAYLALIEEAARLGVRVEGHVPIEVSWQEAASLGVQRSFEHLHSLPIWTTRSPDALHRRWMTYHARLDYTSGIDAAHRLESASIHADAYDQQDASARTGLFHALAAARVWQVPTCTLWRARGASPDSFLGDPRMRLIPPWMRSFWAGWWPQDDAAAVASDFALNARRDAFCLAAVRDMHAAGVPLLAGTDTVMPGVFPGSSLHEELALMVEAGLTPQEALRTATLNPAEFMRRDDIGRIAAGTLADLVLLEGDPLSDIGNTTRIAGVAIGGAWLDASALHALQDRAAAVAAAPSVATGMARLLASDGLDAALSHFDTHCPAPRETADCAGADVGWQVGSALVGHAEGGRTGEFLAWFEQRMQADADALAWLSAELAERDDAEGARRVIDRILRLAPGDPMTLDLRRTLLRGEATR